MPGYEAVREIGRGGGGVVYLARQASLGRLVALKVLRADSAADPEVRRRFRAEAEAVARVRHPNIVQIHEIGEAGGQPYLALEYVPGGTLADRLAGAPLPPAEAAGLVELLARAVHSAHLRGVVHRDLKPSNVLLADEPGGGPLVPKVTDFGLVKRLDASGGSTATAAAAATATGVVVGTPSYMAPEQATGAAVGPATDVYGLGAVLYEVLTGRPPFRGPTLLDTVMQVLADDPVAPRDLQPGLPRDLETVCLTCLRKSPARRYPSALALADDLRRFLDHQPVLARRTGVAARLAKWARRQPAQAVGLVLGAVLLAVLVVYSVRLGWKQDEVEREAARSRAEEQAARDAVAGFYTAVSENRLLREPGMEGLRKELLGKAADFYREFAGRQSDAPAARAELARAHLRLAALTGDLGDPTEGIVLARRAGDEFRALSDEAPDDSGYAVDLAATAERLGDLHRSAGAAAAAEAAYGEAAARWDGLAGRVAEGDRLDRLAGVRERLAGLYRSAGRRAETDAAVSAALALREPRKTDPGGRPRLAALYALAADVHRDRGEDEAAETRLRAAVAAWADHTAPTPGERDDHAGAWHRLGQLCADTDRPWEAAEAFGKAAELRRVLARDHSGIPGFRHRLAVTLCDLAHLHVSQDRGHLVEPLLDEARGLLVALADAHPGIADFRADLARCRDLSMPWYAVTGRWADAEREGRAAAAAWAELCGRHPDRTDFRLGRAEGRRQYGDGAYAAGRSADARAAFGEATRLFEDHGGQEGAFGAARAEYGLGLSLVGARDAAAGPALAAARTRLETLTGAHPRVTRYRVALADTLDMIAQRAAGGGVEVAREALRVREQLAGEFPAVVGLVHEAARGHHRLANRLADAGRPEDSLRELRVGASARAVLLRTFPAADRRLKSDAVVRHELAQTTLQIEEVCTELGRPAEARTAAGDALAVQGELVAAYPNVPAYLDTLAECHYRLAETDRRTGRLTDAEAAYHRALAVRGPLAGAHPTNGLFAVNHAADLVGLARTAARRGRPESAADWAAQAVARLDSGSRPANYREMGDRVLVDALRVRGAALAQTGRVDEAAADWRRLVSSGRDGGWAVVQLCFAETGWPAVAALLAQAAEQLAD
ncbi:serine/threonine protein kinase [bacterium]|nr:serine/threonine protein kinase [bacterium]